MTGRWPDEPSGAEGVIARGLVELFGPARTPLPDPGYWLRYGSDDEPDTGSVDFVRTARALAYAGGSKTKAAQALGISRPTLYARLREHNIGHVRSRASSPLG